MLIPRIIISVNRPLQLAQLKDFGSERLAIYFSISSLEGQPAIEQTTELKKICLQYGWLLVLDDIKTAAIVNADGVILPHGDFSHGLAKDVLGSEKIVGATAHRIDDVAEFWEEGMADVIILESYTPSESSVNILGKQKTQSIMDDARIMGYDIPIIISGGITATNVQEVIDMRCYGIQIDNHNDIQQAFQCMKSSKLH